MLETALKYARNGFEVLPLQANGKVPISNENFPSGFKSATTDENKIQEHWEQYPQSNIGLKISPNMIVLDIDVHDYDGFKSLATLTNHFGKMPHTFTIDTPTGGRHYYFNLPDGVTIERQINAFRGIDILTNGYVVAYPSVINGKEYSIRSGELSSLAECPPWLLNAFKTHKEHSSEEYFRQSNLSQFKPGKKYTGALLDELVNGAQVGGRNNWVMVMTSKMLAVGAELDTIYKLLIVVNDNFFSDPLPLTEIQATFKSRVKKHLGKGE